MDETVRFESKRVSGKMVHKAIETIAAFANTEGGHLVLGMEDFKKAQGDDRLFGIQENPEAVDELRRKIEHRNYPCARWRWLADDTLYPAGWHRRNTCCRRGAKKHNGALCLWKMVHGNAWNAATGK